MNCYWLEQTQANVPAQDHWLSTGEISRLASLRFDKRRTDWKLGRWTAKHAIASCLDLPSDNQSLQDIELRAAPTGAPEVFLFNRKAAVKVSLSHRSGRALSVVSMSQPSLGCDMELVEKRDPSFIADFFTANEQRLVDAMPTDQRSLLTTLLWSAKESALKSLKVGLRLDTTSLEVVLGEIVQQLGSSSCQDDRIVWFPLSVRLTGENTFRGWWRCSNNIVRTVVFRSVGNIDLQTNQGVNTQLGAGRGSLFLATRFSQCYAETCALQQLPRAAMGLFCPVLSANSGQKR